MRMAVLALCALVCLEGTAKAEIATYYGQEFAGRRTASGEKFNPSAIDSFVADLRDTLDFAGISDLAAINLGDVLPEDDEGDEMKAEAPSTQTAKGFEQVEVTFGPPQDDAAPPGPDRQR